MDADEPRLIPLRLESICIAFMQLADRVNLALHTQIGDRLRIQEQNSGVLRMLESIHQHADVIPVAERQVMEETIDNMITLLTAAAVQSEDIPARAAIPIDPSFLAYGLDLRGPTGLAPVAGVSSRTIRRRALDYGLAEPAAPVYTETLDPTSGETVRIYILSTSVPVSNISDDDLDELMHHILEVFPTFGRQMIDSHLRLLGFRIQTSRLRESYNRVHGPLVSYSNTATGRQPYRVYKWSVM
ncbi:hypothetical protein K438DRAFT_1788206 [Mycena galopus ATCC 62051]|nr:hypothetical protein K438DRAFT_1788206 [Mycena galopus ATCC 62051]